MSVNATQQYIDQVLAEANQEAEDEEVFLTYIDDDDNKIQVVLFGSVFHDEEQYLLLKLPEGELPNHILILRCVREGEDITCVDIEDNDVFEAVRAKAEAAVERKTREREPQ